MGKRQRKGKILLIVAVAFVCAVLIGVCVFIGTSKKEKEPVPDSISTESTEKVPEKPKETAEIREGAIYYNSLSEADKEAYNSILEAAENIEYVTDEVDIPMTLEHFGEILSYIRADNPDLFYVNYGEIVLEDGGDCFRADMVYCDTADNIAEMKTAYEEAINGIMNSDSVACAQSELEKEIALHDALVNSCSSTDSTEFICSTAYGALVNKEAHCDGYAYAMKTLLNRVGVEAYSVYGTAADADHVWNKVKIDGIWYNLDAMWDDADMPIDLCFHGYFNLSDEMIFRDHIEKNAEILPDAVSENDYYSATDKKTSSLDGISEIFKNELSAAISEGREYIEVFCTESNDNDTLGQYLVPCIKEANSANGEKLYELFTVYPASAQTNAVTIQIFYK